MMGSNYMQNGSGLYVPPSAQDVLNFHTNSDVDSGVMAQHHTLGNSSSQAAPGNLVDFRRQGWTSYAPTLSGITLGGAGAAVNGFYKRDWDVVDFYLMFMLGSGGSVAGPSLFASLPIAPLSNASYMSLEALITDTGTTTYVALAILAGANVNIWNYATGGTYAQFATIGPTAPMTWVPGDYAEAHGRYRVAA